MKKKVIALALGCTVAFGCAVGGTLAWLTAKGEPVVNVFTPSDINITLSETTGDNYKMIPGDTLVKDPKVKVESGSEACWLFVAITESDNLDSFITYDVADGWTKLNGCENIYWRSVSADDIEGDKSTFYILKGNDDFPNGCVTVKNTVTKTDMEDIKETTAQPKLTFNACAVQRAHLETIDKAWEQADANFKYMAVEETTTP